MLDTGLEHVERSADVHFERRAGVVVAVQQPQRREMEDAVHAFHRRVQDVPVKDVTAQGEHLDARIPQRTGEVLLAAAGEVVEDADLVHILLHQLVHSVRADQAGPANHKQLLALEVHLTCPARTMPPLHTSNS